MENILKDAAKAHLMVIFHGVNKPTGDSYTYPNLLAKRSSTRTGKRREPKNS